jgi:hypothetical protein
MRQTLPASSVVKQPQIWPGATSLPGKRPPRGRACPLYCWTNCRARFYLSQLRTPIVALIFYGECCCHGQAGAKPTGRADCGAPIGARLHSVIVKNARAVEVSAAVMPEHRTIVEAIHWRDARRAQELAGAHFAAAAQRLAARADLADVSDAPAGEQSSLERPGRDRLHHVAPSSQVARAAPLD